MKFITIYLREMCFFVHLFVCKLLALIFLSFLFLNTTLYMCIERSQFYAETQASFNVCCQSKLHEGRAHRIVFGCFYFYSDEMQLLLLHTTETRYQTIESGNESCCIKRATLWQQRFQVYSLFLVCVCDIYIERHFIFQLESMQLTINGIACSAFFWLFI